MSVPAGTAPGVPGPPHPGPAVVLCGPMGAGKSTVGAALARRWGVRLRDLDHDVERVAGERVAAIFAERGEQGFRQLEHAALLAALTEHDGVLALGGGAVLLPENRAALAGYAAGGGQVVLLDVDVDAAMARVGRDPARPLLVGDARERWTALMAERRPLYLEVATMRVRTSGRTLAQVAADVDRRVAAGAAGAARSDD